MSTSIENSLCEAIEYIVNNAVSNAEYDRTITCTIVEHTDATIGKFKVKYQDSSFYAYALSTEVTYSTGSEVYVLVPGNDFSRDKTILGTTDKLGSNYSTEAEGEEAWETVGTNCIESADSFEFCSYSSDMVQVIYDKDDSSLNQIDLNLTSVETYLKNCEAILCGATIRTDLPSEQQYKGNYGVIFELNFYDNATKDTIVKYYVLDVNQMTGNPYNLIYATRQYGIFEIDTDNFIDVNRIYVFVEDFIQGTNMPADIFISNLELTGMNALSSDELTGCALTFVTPKGIYFDDNDLDSATRPIQAEVRVKGKTVDNSSQSLDYYWFVEDVRVNTKSEKYNKYGGQGWQCLNEYNIITAATDSESAVVEWVPADYEYIVTKSDSYAKYTTYKCVVIYDTTILSKEITIINYSSNYDLVISSDSGTSFYYDIGTPSLTLTVNGEEETSGDYTYSWAEVDSNNNFYSMPETDEYNDEYDTAEGYYQMYYLQFLTGTLLEEKATALMNKYLTIMEKYDTITRVDMNRVYKIQVKTIDNFSTFKCSVFYKGTFIGTASIVLTNSYETVAGYSLVINNGSQVFKYNEEGISPANSTVENPLTLLPLSFTLYDNQGTAISNSVLEKQATIKWLVPIDDTLLSIPDTYDEDLNENFDSTQYAEYDNLLSISYEIADRYDVKKSNNNIQLTVEYKGLTSTAMTNFTFAKEGDPGTNGTEYLVKIVPNIASGSLNGYPTMLNGELNYTPRQSGRYLKIQLWHNGENIFDSVVSGASTEGKEVDVVWEMLGNNWNGTTDQSCFTVDADTGIFSYSGYGTDNDAPANVVKATVTYDGLIYYATLPFITATSSEGYSIENTYNTGYRFATYSADGRRAYYDDTNPFEVTVHQEVDEYNEDITYSTNEEYALTYQWYIKGKIYNPVAEEWVASINLKLKNSSSSYTTNPINIIPYDEYTNECVNNAIECVVSHSDEEVARIHIPIHLMLNRYGHAALNSWDGNSITIDEDGGVILAPQVGAGKKEDDNSFTGMVMGQVKETNQSTEDVGLIAYHKGERTMHLSALDGYAIFGKNGPGQIIMDPTSDEGLIYSNDFWAEYYDDNTDSARNGLPVTSYEYDENNHYYNGQKYIKEKGRTDYGNDNTDDTYGMLIDLTTPRILFGNGNFRVDPDGFLYARGGGEIAGWYIDDYKFHSKDGGSAENTGTTGMSSVYNLEANGVTAKEVKVPSGYNGATIQSNYATVNKAYAFWAGYNRRNETSDSDKFVVSHDGYVRMQEATIGSGRSVNYLIFVGNSASNSSYSAIYSYNKDGLSVSNNGFYLGPDGLGIGTNKGWASEVGEDGETSSLNSPNSAFEVLANGMFYARKGYIGNGVSGWTVKDDCLFNGKNTFNTISNGVYIGTQGIALGANTNKYATTSSNNMYSAAFKVYNNGQLVSTKGFIGNWIVSDYTINSGSNLVGLGAINDINATGAVVKNAKIPNASADSGYTAQNKAIAFWAGSSSGNSTEFYVTHEGHVRMNTAEIGSGTNRIFIAANSTNSAIYGNGKSSIMTDRNGFYMGVDGIALGPLSKMKISGIELNNSSASKFYVLNNGDMRCTNAYISGTVYANNGTVGGWNITSNAIISTDGNVALYNSGTLTGPNWDLYSNGTARFGGSNVVIYSNGYATFNGKITSNEGKIGGCTISNSRIYTSGWSINSDGTATFSSGTFTGAIYATSGTIGGWTITSSSLTGSGTISGGTVTGSTISGGTISGTSMSGSTVTGGSINIGSSTYYLRMGQGTDNPEVSGLTVGSQGIAMGGRSGISDIKSMSFVADATITSPGALYISAGGVNIEGGLNTDTIRVNGKLGQSLESQQIVSSITDVGLTVSGILVTYSYRSLTFTGGILTSFTDTNSVTKQ